MTKVLSGEFARDAFDRERRVDLTQVWEAAGRPKGKSPRSWRHTTLCREAVDVFANRRGVSPDGIFHDPGGPKAHVTADVAVAAVYTATLAPGFAEGSLGMVDDDDRADVRRLLGEEERRKVAAEHEREQYHMPSNAIDRVRAGVVDPRADPGAEPGGPRPRGAPPLGDPNHACSECGSRESVFLASLRPDRRLCHECRRR